MNSNSKTDPSSPPAASAVAVRLQDVKSNIAKEMTTTTTTTTSSSNDNVTGASKARAFLLLNVVNMLFGTNHVLLKVVSDQGTSSSVQLFLRFGIAALALSPWSVFDEWVWSQWRSSAYLAEPWSMQHATPPKHVRALTRRLKPFTTDEKHVCTSVKPQVERTRVEDVEKMMTPTAPVPRGPSCSARTWQGGPSIHTTRVSLDLRLN